MSENAFHFPDQQHSSDGPMSPGERWRAELLTAEAFTWLPEELATVKLASEALDRAASAQELLDRDGLVIQGLHGPRTHPAVAIKRDAEAAFLRFAKLLRLHDREALP